MPPPSAILVAVDFSAGSSTALRVAALIAHRHAATVTLVHVDRIPEIVEREGMRMPADVWASYLRERSESARHLLEEQATMLSGVSTQVAVASGDVAPAIFRQVSSERIDLVVLGAHGAGTRRHSWVGSVPFEVAANTQAPVLVVRERRAPQDERGFRRPLIAVGFGGAIDAEVAVADWLCADDAILELVHVSEWPAEGMMALPASKAREEALAQRASRFRDEATRLRGGAVAIHIEDVESTSEAILERIERESHDLVVVGQRAVPKASGLLGPAARRLLEYADASVALTPSSSAAIRR